MPSGAAGKYLVDLFAGGKGTALGTLYVGKLLDPIRPLLLLPDVLDETKWWRREHKYVDPENKYIFAYIGNAGGVEINYNSTSVNPKEFTSYWDLTQPKWKGKIAATDPRSRGMDNPCCFFTTMPNLVPSSFANFTETWRWRSRATIGSRWIGWHLDVTPCAFPVFRMKWTRRWIKVCPWGKFSGSKKAAR